MPADRSPAFFVDGTRAAQRRRGARQSNRYTNAFVEKLVNLADADFAPESAPGGVVDFVRPMLGGLSRPGRLS
jgi:hypothetical protein